MKDSDDSLVNMTTPMDDVETTAADDVPVHATPIPGINAQQDLPVEGVINSTLLAAGVTESTLQGHASVTDSTLQGPEQHAQNEEARSKEEASTDITDEVTCNDQPSSTRGSIVSFKEYKAAAAVAAEGQALKDKERLKAQYKTKWQGQREYDSDELDL